MGTPSWSGCPMWQRGSYHDYSFAVPSCRELHHTTPLGEPLAPISARSAHADASQAYRISKVINRQLGRGAGRRCTCASRRHASTQASAPAVIHAANSVHRWMRLHRWHVRRSSARVYARICGAAARWTSADGLCNSQVARHWLASSWRVVWYGILCSAQTWGATRRTL